MFRIKRLVGICLACLLTFGASLPAMAAVQAPAPSAKVSFTFDDGYASAYTQAAPILAKYGLKGTDYVITGCVGMTKKPNTCRANQRTTYMSWDQITALQNTYGWEIGSHTVTHPYLATYDASDGQPAPLTPAQVDYELSQSKAQLAAHGFNAIDFASPYGDYNNAVLADAAKYYATQRGYADLGYNVWPYSDYLVRVEQVKKGTTPAQVQSFINSAKANNQWLVLVFHDIISNPTRDDYSITNFDKVAAYAKRVGMPSVTVAGATLLGDTNILPNGDFAAGLSGWTTNSPSSFVADTAGNGSYPNPTYSVRFNSTTTSTYLLSSPVSIDPNATYGFKSFLNVLTNTGGEIGYYVDEYNGFGQWISGQYKYAEKSAFVEEANFVYKATSANVAQARLQIFMTGVSGTSGYLSQIQWFPLTAVSPPPAPTSLLPNSNFDAGLSAGWRTDAAANITADSGSHGSPANPVNSIKLVAAAQNIHLFSPSVAVTNKTYNLNLYLNVQQISSGEVGFYIDEYNANGQWTSGQYKTGVRSTGAGNVGFSYTPTSASVAYASLQVIVVGGSNIVAYFDNAIWL